MTDDKNDQNRRALITALNNLASSIEASPPPIIGNDIFVHATGGGSAIGSSVSVTAGPGGGSSVGQRISVVANRPGQSVIGQRIVVVAGGAPQQVAALPSGAKSSEEIDDTIRQLREAAKALESSPASESWIKGVLATAEKWGSAALSGAISGASNAAARFYFG